ncbi:hypothetical protein [Edaphobacter bradus]|uniref:hypothetical protein n=1 Tax=Edaphobacter bradus TaxID=2259016 RepID=UPI0021DFF032|nr:hypothetical protein [Edaphobacter bradus]
MSNHSSHFGFCLPYHGMRLAAFLLTTVCVMQTKGFGAAVGGAVLRLLWPSCRKFVRSWARQSCPFSSRRKTYQLLSDDSLDRIEAVALPGVRDSIPGIGTSR